MMTDALHSAVLAGADSASQPAWLWLLLPPLLAAILSGQELAVQQIRVLA